MFLNLVQEAEVALEIFGGASESIFPKVEALVDSSREYQKALIFITSKKGKSQYRSLLDFLFCEIFPKQKARCFEFYLSGENPLREILSRRQILDYENKLLRALIIARVLLKENYKASWSNFRQMLDVA